MNFLEKESALFLEEFGKSELFPTNIALSSERIFYDVENTMNSSVEQCDLSISKKNKRNSKKRRKKAGQFLPDKRDSLSAQELSRLRVLKRFEKTMDPAHLKCLSKLLLSHMDVSKVNAFLFDNKTEKYPRKSFSAQKELIEYENTLDAQDVEKKKDNVDKALRLMDYSSSENSHKIRQMDLVLGLIKENTESKKDVMDRVLGIFKVLTVNLKSSVPFFSCFLKFKRDSVVKHKSTSLVLPPLVPVSLYGYNKEKWTVNLTDELVESIRGFLPPRLQLQDKWKLVYSLDYHGASLLTLYSKSFQNRGVFGSRPGFLLVVKDSDNHIFGAFINEYLHLSTSYYGSMECFVWKMVLNSSAEDSNKHYSQLKVFMSTGINNYMILCDNSFLSIGGGDGKYGLWLDSRLEKGISTSTQTFNNEALSDSVKSGERFDIIGVEIWKI
ncbi:uncharacterized protein T551_02350 [Pneumocystis jirovecii RU7]|uniref:Oxidation resistance protein 1 n=2 Tax=Pneumocystis jirovecii TaxID=42068 RepID=A0A0W4ZL18_PNEJ7|nr:uncharacterized protein T551_02350 [Pneumocystis jirovecii RU7]KTW29076.1 hypothetical protein T551_02350 [Pneumocystis jirovecii RU7]